MAKGCMQAEVLPLPTAPKMAMPVYSPRSGRVSHPVTLEADPTGDTRDRYGRLLRYVRLDGENFNARLIREGYGHAIRRFRYSLKAQFIRLEDSARKAGRGLWSPR